LVLVCDEGEDAVDLVAEFSEAVQQDGVLPLCAGEFVELGGELLGVAAEAVDLDDECRQGRGGLLRVFRTVDLELIHAARCRFRYSSWASCGVL
jgi:hypothetical protein